MKEKEVVQLAARLARQYHILLPRLRQRGKVERTFFL